MAAMLWWLCYGSYAIAAKETYFLIYISITTITIITTVTTITTITIIYSCLQPIQRFNATPIFLHAKLWKSCQVGTVSLSNDNAQSPKTFWSMPEMNHLSKNDERVARLQQNSSSCCRLQTNLTQL